MGVWTEHVVPRFVELSLRSEPVGELRARALRDLHGEVAEIGFGSGLNLRYYPSAVSKIDAVEPSTVAREIARPRIESCAIPVELVGLDGTAIPLADESVDAAVSTFTLCTIPEVGSALREIARILRPGGRFHFLEHGRSDEARVAVWQHRLDGLQQRLAGGCHLDRPIAELIRGAGFAIERLEHPRLPGPAPSKPWTYLSLGVAVVA